MAYIHVVHEDEADGKLFSVYDDVQKTRGRLSNVLRIQSLDPKGMKAHLDLYLAHVYRTGGLPRMEREMIAVVVSATNGCGYCVTHHSEALRKYADEAFVQAIGNDWKQAELTDAQRALCEFAVDLTRDPAGDRAGAVERLRAAGFDDESILHATEMVSYFNYVNRLVTGLGVELEADQDRDYNY